VNEEPVVVELVDARVVLPLRRAVLRPDQPAPCSEYGSDDEPHSAHVAVRLTGPPSGIPDGLGESPGVAGVVAVGSVLREPPPWEPPRRDGWRVRGMATHPDVRGRGFGGLVLVALLDHVAVQGGGLVWCNARVPARSLYARAGFAARGAVFDIPAIGPHLQMWRTVPGHLPPADTRSLTDGCGSGEGPAD